jgi:type IV secretory pathway ATPase VirB11/archaellum biosynthesis ATPase
MTAHAAQRPRSLPFYWWGLPWSPAFPRTLSDLVHEGMISANMADFLFGHVRSGGSIVVAASQSGAGKSTLAHALLAGISADRTLAHIRGTYESFDWLGSALPTFTTILVNEISPHLPTYCWGDSARTVLRLAAGGYQLIATLHAANPAEAIGLLRAAPIHASDDQIVALNVVVFLDIYEVRGAFQRRVSSIVRLEQDSATDQSKALTIRIAHADLPV